MNILKESVLDLDAFGKPVLMNFRGRDRFTTIRGGLLTIVVYLCSSYFGYNLVNQLIYRQDPTIQEFDMRLDHNEEFQLSESLSMYVFNTVKNF